MFYYWANLSNFVVENEKVYFDIFGFRLYVGHTAVYRIA